MGAIDFQEKFGIGAFSFASVPLRICLPGGEKMRSLITIMLLTMAAVSALAASKESGNATLKDAQPAGLTDKQNKKQRYDLSFESSGKDYTCRTSEKASIKATDLVVGSTVSYQIDGDKAKVKTSAKKQLSCTIVRVAIVAAIPK